MVLILMCRFRTASFTLSFWLSIANGDDCYREPKTACLLTGQCIYGLFVLIWTTYLWCRRRPSFLTGCNTFLLVVLINKHVTDGRGRWSDAPQKYRGFACLEKKVSRTAAVVEGLRAALGWTNLWAGGGRTTHRLVCLTCDRSDWTSSQLVPRSCQQECAIQSETSTSLIVVCQTIVSCVVGFLWNIQNSITRWGPKFAHIITVLGSVSNSGHLWPCRSMDKKYRFFMYFFLVNRLSEEMTTSTFCIQIDMIYLLWFSKSLIIGFRSDGYRWKYHLK